MLQQDGHHCLADSTGKRPCQTGRIVVDAVLAQAGGQRGGSVPPHPSPVAALRGCTNGLLLLGCVLKIGPPWKASHGRGGLAGGRSAGAAPLACGWPLRFFLLEGDARYAALAPASRPARRAPQLRWVPALTPAPFAWASPRKGRVPEPCG